MSENEIIQVLLSRLCEKGLSPEEIPWLIRDFLNTVWEEKRFTVQTVTCKLVRLGWPEEIIDLVTFELMVCFLEKESTIEVRRFSIH